MKDLKVYSDKELIQIILGDKTPEVADQILTYQVGGLRALNRIDEAYLLHLGVTQGRREKLLCSLELGRRIQFAEVSENFTVKSSSDVFEFFKPSLSALSHEQFHIVYLNRANRLIKDVCISKGGLTGTVVDTRIILKEALILNASSMVLVHNHPSGNKMPSSADITITKKLTEAGKAVEIPVLDHIIIADQSYYSFADDGAL